MRLIQNGVRMLRRKEKRQDKEESIPFFRWGFRWRYLKQDIAYALCFRRRDAVSFWFAVSYIGVCIAVLIAGGARYLWTDITALYSYAANPFLHALRLFSSLIALWLIVTGMLFFVRGMLILRIKERRMTHTGVLGGVMMFLGGLIWVLSFYVFPIK